jgi:Flp pilus assembly protein TadG
MQRWWKDESGQTAVAAELGLLVIIGCVALGVDVGHLYNAKRNLQAAADSAAVAGALEIEACEGTPNCTAMQTAVQAAVAEDGLTVGGTATNCGTSAASGIIVSVNDPPCAMGASDPNYGKASYVEVTVSEQVPTYFARVLGFSSVPLIARAEAARTGNPNCIYALDPSSSNSISTDLLAVVNAHCGVVDESSSSSAFGCNLLASFSATKINVTGGDESLLCGISPNPTTGVKVPTPADPLAYLPTPTVPACGTSTGSPYDGSSSTLTLIGNVTLKPDYAYCGGIVILPGANVTFEPGTYVIKSAPGLLGIPVGGLTISLLANVTGTGVTFYNYGPVGGVTFLVSAVTLGGVTLTAPTSGTYSGILFFQDPGNTTAATILGDSSLNSDLEGAMYFPTARVSYAVNVPAKYNILVAYDIDFVLLSFSGTNFKSSFSNDYSSLTMGSPIAGNTVALMQ